MNFPGVLYEDEEVMKKIAAAHHLLNLLMAMRRD